MEGVSDVLELLGAALVVAGVALFSVPCAFIIAGVALVIAAYSLGPTKALDDAAVMEAAMVAEIARLREELEAMTLRAGVIE